MADRCKKCGATLSSSGTCPTCDEITTECPWCGSGELRRQGGEFVCLM